MLPRAEVDNWVIFVHHRIQNSDQVEQSLVQVSGIRFEPLPNKHNHWSTKFVYSCLVETARLFYFC